MDVKYDVILGELREGDSGGGGGGSYIPTSEKGVANGVATLDANGKVPQAELDVPAPLILDSAPTTATVGVPGQLAVNTATNKTYHCTAVTTSGDPAVTTYTWTDDINAKGGNIIGGLIVSGGNLRIANYTAGGLTIGDSNGSAVPGFSGIAYTNCRNGNWNAFAGGTGCRTYNGFAFAFGQYVECNGPGAALGKYSTTSGNNDLVAFRFGIGTSTSNRRNGVELSWSGNLYIAGGHQQEITEIPAATTAYTPAEGVYKHTPDTAPTYTLPTITQLIIVDGRYFTRNTATDGTGYYGWLSGTTNRYTAFANPAVGDNTYTNTALTQGAKPITAIDERTHTIILNVLFRGYYRSAADDSGSAFAWKAKDDTILYTDTATPTAGTTLAYSDAALTASVGTIALYDSAKSGIAMVGSLEFEDAGGNVIVPLDGPSPSVGAEICYLCEWSALQGQWTIMPIGMGGEG